MLLGEFANGFYEAFYGHTAGSPAGDDAGFYKDARDVFWGEQALEFVPKSSKRLTVLRAVGCRVVHLYKIGDQRADRLHVLRYVAQGHRCKKLPVVGIFKT